MCDAKDAMQLADLTNSLDAYISQCKEEKRRITDLDAEVGHQSCADPERFFRGGPTLTTFFFFFFFFFWGGGSF